MGAAVGERELAAKVVSVFPGNLERGEATIGGLVIALDPLTGKPLAVLPGAWLTAMRTGAASGIATKMLAVEDASVGLVVGAGAQARTQALAIDAVRSLKEIRIYARNPEAGRALVNELSGALSAEPLFVESLADAVVGAQIICMATSAREPLLLPDMLEPGMHVNAVGSFRPEMREFSVGVIARSRVFVDSVSACSEEAGELIDAEAKGVMDRGAWTELGALIEGGSVGRTSAEEVTLFKSVGVAEQDACAAGEALRMAVSMGLGTEVDLS
jgi:ornithine cyclodeaminase/alanine dehydrogenase-like protein (mu-crystallin family)